MLGWQGLARWRRSLLICLSAQESRISGSKSATVMLIKGVHPKIVSERLGHSNISTAMDIYSHVIPGLQEEAANVVDEALSDDG